MSDRLASISVHQDNHTTTVAVSGEIDLSNADELLTDVLAAFEGPLDAVLDLGQVTYMDSSGVRLVHTLSGRLQPNRSLSITAPEGTFAHMILRLTGFEDPVVDDSER